MNHLGMEKILIRKQIFSINSGSEGAGYHFQDKSKVQGKELSYNNIADTDAAIECVSNF